MSSETKPRKRLSAARRRELIEAAATELFARRSYPGASIEEIARRSGVSPPVVYDHFASKIDLYRQLLESHFAQLRAIWEQNFRSAEGSVSQVSRSFDAWFSYVEEHPAAARMLFREPSGDRQAEAVHRQVSADSRDQVMELFATHPGSQGLTGSLAGPGLELTWVVLRGVLQGLALWWVDHPEVPREQVVATAMNSLWIGFERAVAGEGWVPSDSSG